MSTPEQPAADATYGDQNVTESDDSPGPEDGPQTEAQEPLTEDEVNDNAEGDEPLEIDGGTVAGVSRKKDDGDGDGKTAQEEGDPQGPIDLDSDGDADGPEGEGLTDAEKAKAVGGFNAPDPAIYDASGGSTKDVLGGSGLPGSVSPGHGNDQ